VIGSAHEHGAQENLDQRESMQRRAEIKCQKGLLPTDPIRFVASV
jgi:hypothetical protein